MMKLVVALAAVCTLSACAFDPVQYDKQRMAENAQHLRTMG